MVANGIDAVFLYTSVQLFFIYNFYNIVIHDFRNRDGHRLAGRRLSRLRGRPGDSRDAPGRGVLVETGIGRVSGMPRLLVHPSCRALERAQGFFTGYAPRASGHVGHGGGTPSGKVRQGNRRGPYRNLSSEGTGFRGGEGGGRRRHPSRGLPCRCVSCQARGPRCPCGSASSSGDAGGAGRRAGPSGSSPSMSSRSRAASSASRRRMRSS